MKIILFELFPTSSHHKMVFKTARLLKESGYRVFFGSMPEMKEIILQNGFEYYYLSYQVIIKLDQHLLLKKQRGIALPTEEQCLKNAIKNFEILREQIAEIKPDIIFLDRHMIVDKTIFYKLLGIQVAFVCPMPDPSRANNIPPFSSGFVPKDGWLYGKYISYLWMINKIKGKLVYLWIQLVYPRINEFNILNKLKKELGINTDEHRMPKNDREIQQRTTPRIILSATDLEFPRPIVEGVYTVGPLIDFPEDDYKSTDLRYEAMKSIFTKGKGSVIYCSLGMLDDFCTDQKVRLYRKIKQVALLSKDDYFVLCTGVDLDNSDLLPLPPNMFVFKSLPQNDLLKYCTVMINHGGLNSITECIFNEIPVIAFPPSHQADHSCNSAKVVYHGLGLRGKIRRDSPQSILKKINQIRSNYDWYLTNLRQMKQKFEQKNQSTEVVTIIESIITNNGKI
jgi:zeaxanthin glucosyltransferase